MADKRLIDANALLDAMPKNDELLSLDVRRVICDAPTIDAVEVVHAEWLTNSDVPDTLICSKCGRRFDMYFFDQKDMPYCLCGAKMDGGAEC